MNDLEENLIAGQGKRQAQQKQKRFEECEHKIKTLRNKNNELQKQCDNELESDIREAVRQQTAFIENEIKDMKKALEALARQYTDLGSKKRIKDLCNLASRQMERNKRIMSQYLNRASSSSSYYRRQSGVAFRKSRTQFQYDIPNNRQSRDKKLDPVHEHRNDVSVGESQDLLSDIKAEQKMQAERNQLIKELEEKNNKINQIINEMGSLVGGQQKDMVDQIQANNMITYENVVRANEQLDDARKYQKKGKKKYIAVIIIILLVLIIAAGVVYFAIPS